jgi:hypothetical protein
LEGLQDRSDHVLPGPVISFVSDTSSLSDLTPWGEPDRLRARFDRVSRIFPR